MDSLPTWTYRNKEINSIEDFPSSTVGFVYLILFDNGYYYLGRKVLFFNKKRKVKNKKRKVRYTIESDWKKYVGSSKKVKSLTKENKLKPVKRTILKVCKSLSDLTYYETKYLFQKDAIKKPNYYNENILGKFFRSKK